MANLYKFPSPTQHMNTPGHAPETIHDFLLEEFFTKLTEWQTSIYQQTLACYNAMYTTHTLADETISNQFRVYAECQKFLENLLDPKNRPAVMEWFNNNQLPQLIDTAPSIQNALDHASGKVKALMSHVLGEMEDTNENLAQLAITDRTYRFFCAFAHPKLRELAEDPITANFTNKILSPFFHITNTLGHQQMAPPLH